MIKNNYFFINIYTITLNCKKNKNIIFFSLSDIKLRFF